MKSISVVLSIIIVISLVILNYNSRVKNKKTIEKISQEHSYTEFLKEEYLNVLKFNTRFDYSFAKQLISSLQLIEKYDNNDRKKIIALVPNEACGSCIQSLIVYLTSWQNNYSFYYASNNFSFEIYRFLISNNYDPEECIQLDLKLLNEINLQNQIILIKLTNDNEYLSHFVYNPKIPDLLSVFL